MSAELTQNQFVELVQAHQGILHKICRVYAAAPEDHQDLYQEILIQLWKSYGSFRGEAKFSTWMYRIALNTAISDLRRQQRKVKVLYPEEAPAGLAAEPLSLEKEEQLQKLYAAIGELGEIDKALVMLYLEDRSYDEMEAILGINQNHLRVKMNRIKEKLRKRTKTL